jgi:hypothetical protein
MHAMERLLDANIWITQGSLENQGPPPSLLKFVQKLPTTKGGRIEVGVRVATNRGDARELCDRWVSQVHGPFIEGDTSRADAEWDWDLEIPGLTFAIGIRRRPRLLQLHTADDGFPLGMVALLENERWIGRHQEPAVYVWYLAGAPSAAFAKRREIPKLLTAATLDSAITLSLNGPAEGRLWLHAAPEGGERLLEWYSGVGLERVPERIRLPGPVLRPRRNDGRYFRLMRATAVTVSSRLTEYR